MRKVTRYICRGARSQVLGQKSFLTHAKTCKWMLESLWLQVYKVSGVHVEWERESVYKPRLPTTDVLLI